MQSKMSRGNRFSVAALAVAVLFFGACSSSPSAPGNEPFTVSGQLVDVQSRAILSGATVAFGDLLSPAVLPGDPKSVTDANGSYQLSLMAGDYHVWVDNVYSGLARVRRSVNRIDLLAHDAGCAVRYGTVGDASTGKPIAGASVSLVGVTATSGSDGTYRLDFGCRGPFAFTGTVEMSITRSGYQDRMLPMGRGEDLTRAIRQDVDLAPR
jgi:hypothetical protein